MKSSSLQRAETGRGSTAQPKCRATATLTDNRTQATAQRKLQHAATAKLSQSRQPIQMVREEDFRRSPEEFLITNVLSLTMDKGLMARAGSNATLATAYPKFLAKLASFPRHWFKLVPDANRTKNGRTAYILTPAIEKYAEAYPTDEILAPLRDIIPGVLPTESAGSYITSAYVEYKNIGVGGRPDETVGHTSITRSRDNGAVAFNPDFVFTATMNGCAFVATPGATPDDFTAWHFQSTTANADSASTFRRTAGPTDWYGEEEYDTGHHEGLFEVTNFLHRDKHNQWHVISQQNETASTDMNTVDIRKVDKRALNLAATDRVAMTKRVYTSLQKNHHDDVRRCAANALKYAEYFDKDETRILGSLLAIADRELTKGEAELAATRTMPELNRVSETLRTHREAQIGGFTLMADRLRQYLEKKYEEEDKKVEGRFSFLGKSKSNKLKDIELAQTNIRDMTTGFAKISWMTSLKAETA